MKFFTWFFGVIVLFDLWNLRFFINITFNYQSRFAIHWDILNAMMIFNIIPFSIQQKWIFLIKCIISSPFQYKCFICNLYSVANITYKSIIVNMKFYFVKLYELLEMYQAFFVWNVRVANRKKNVILLYIWLYLLIFIFLCERLIIYCFQNSHKTQSHIEWLKENI